MIDEYRREERAAILEFDAGYDRETAERLAAEQEKDTDQPVQTKKGEV